MFSLDFDSLSSNSTADLKSFSHFVIDTIIIDTHNFKSEDKRKKPPNKAAGV